MRIACIVAVLCLSACAGDRLSLAPPSEVNFSGRWQLNEAESDDPQRLVLSQLGASSPGGADDSGGGQGGQGRGGRGARGSRGGGGLSSGAGFGLPSIPAVGALSDGLRWPGKDVEIKQVAGVVAVTSAGISRVYQPAAEGLRRAPHHHGDDDADRRPDVRPRDRDDGPPAVCGWDGRTLVVQSGDADEDHPPFEQRFSISEDGSRLVEVIGFKGGRTGGFTMSRAWDRVSGATAQ